MFHPELSHVFDLVIPQLLLFPNADDPYNEEASDLYNRDITQFRAKVEGIH